MMRQSDGEGDRERRAYVRAEDDDNELSISDDANTHYHHQIICSAAPKCDTSTCGERMLFRHQLSAASGLSSIWFLSETSAVANQVYSLTLDLMYVSLPFEIFCWRLNIWTYTKSHVNIFLNKKVFSMSVYLFLN